MIYFDEAAFNNWLHWGSSWMRPDSRIHTIIPQQRVGGVTVFGAIGDAVKKPVFWYGKSTTIDEFHKFIPILVDSLTDHAKKVKPYLIIDNHRADFFTMRWHKVARFPAQA